MVETSDRWMEFFVTLQGFSSQFGCQNMDIRQPLTLNKMSIKGIYIIIKAVYNESIANIILSGEKLKSFL